MLFNKTEQALIKMLRFLCCDVSASLPPPVGKRRHERTYVRWCFS